MSVPLLPRSIRQRAIDGHAAAGRYSGLVWCCNLCGHQEAIPGFWGHTCRHGEPFDPEDARQVTVRTRPDAG